MLIHVVWCGRSNDPTLLYDFTLPYYLMWNVYVMGTFSQVIRKIRLADTCVKSLIHGLK